MTDNTNSFIMGGERRCCAAADPLSDPVIVAAGVTLGETLGGLAHMSLRGETAQCLTTGGFTTGSQLRVSLTLIFTFNFSQKVALKVVNPLVSTV